MNDSDEQTVSDSEPVANQSATPVADKEGQGPSPAECGKASQNLQLTSTKRGDNTPAKKAEALKSPEPVGDAIRGKAKKDTNSGPNPKPETAIASQPIDGSPPNSGAIEKPKPGAPPAWVQKKFEQEYDAYMKGSFGTEHPNARHRLFEQMNGIRPDRENLDYESLDSLVGILHGIGPRDQLEGLLALQIAATHTLAMECMRRASSKEQTDLGVELNINRATKLIRACASVTEALSHYRSRGGQKMTVEHVHIHKGGQAIVGQVNQKNTRIKRKKTNGHDERG